MNEQTEDIWKAYYHLIPGWLGDVLTPQAANITLRTLTFGLLPLNYEPQIRPIFEKPSPIRVLMDYDFENVDKTIDDPKICTNSLFAYRFSKEFAIDVTWIDALLKNRVKDWPNIRKELEQSAEEVKQVSNCSNLTDMAIYAKQSFLNQLGDAFYGSS